MKKKTYVASAAVLMILLLALVSILNNGDSPPAPLDENGLIYLKGNVEFVVGNTTYCFGNISTWIIEITDDYLRIGDTYYYGNGNQTNGANYTYAFMINQSYNLVSWPIFEVIPKANITVLYNNSFYTWQEAADNIIISPYVHPYDNAIGAYYLSDYFYPFQGHWVYSHHDEVILIYEVE